MEAVTLEDLEQLLRRAAQSEGAVIDEDVARLVAQSAGGDARVALNMLELCLARAAACPPAASSASSCPATRQSGDEAAPPLQPLRLTRAEAEIVLTSKTHLVYDKAGDSHYNVISALHKSVRGGDADAAVYYLARMLEAGEDPLYVARRVVRMATEDIGFGAPQALPLCVAAYQACHFTGMPECSTALTTAVVYLCKCPKSNAMEVAYKEASRLVSTFPQAQVPMHLRNAPTQLMRQSGYGKNYIYTNQPTVTPHAARPPNFQQQTYLPDILQGKKVVPDF
eukprot:GHVT01063827.1.p1 GENE.GHVT01063827.1~~GHVT01063827.1.p1  ORF type:complete len:330 (+),score=77.63 GHVT01063827.1:146-991(+)